jgi:hypothetical protein
MALCARVASLPGGIAVELLPQVMEAMNWELVRE